MKTIMQIAPVQVSPQPPATDPSTTQKPSNKFTPHLEKAVTTTSWTTSDNSTKTPAHTVPQAPINSDPAATDPIYDTVPPEDIASGSAMDQAGKKLFSPVELLSGGNELPLSSVKLQKPVQPPAQNPHIKPPEISGSEELTGQKPETPIKISKITTQTAEQELQMKAPGKEGMFQEITGEENPSLTAEKELSAARQDKNGTALTSQEIKMQPPERNPDNEPGRMGVAKEAAGQKPTIMPASHDVNIQVPVKPLTEDIASLNFPSQATGNQSTLSPELKSESVSLSQLTASPLTKHKTDFPRFPEPSTRSLNPVKPLAQDIASLNSPSQATGDQSTLSPELKSESVPLSQLTASLLEKHKTDFPQFPEPFTRSLNQPYKFDLTGVQSHRASDSPSGIGQNQTLLQQLQQIIESGNETGTVTIEATANSYSFQYRGAGGAKLGDIASSRLHEPGSSIGEKNGSKIPALRQDLMSQYFDAKLNTNEKGDTTQNPQTNDPQNNSHSQLTSGSQKQHPSVLTEQTSSFQNIASTLQDIQTSQSQSIIKQITLPSGTVVDEDNVIQQVAERFQINNRANDIKLNLKLHPEELGELKIDFTLKEGSIKGNVVVQSQQIQEVIEKNMAKLRSILEDQGFTVEEIVVTSESESVTDFELFEQHLSQQSDLTPSFTDTQQENDFEVALEDAVIQSADSSTGVNIKV